LAERVIHLANGGLKVSPPLSLYIHLPWCVKKCPYCDFNSHAAQTLPEAAYIDALLLDLERALPDIWGRRIHTVFFGGGTPSLFSADGIDRILTGVRTLTQLMPECGNHARGQPRHGGSGQVRRLPRRRRDACIARHPELQSAPSQGAGAHP
jgi:hypothetical protein